MQPFPKDITDAMRTCILAIFWPTEQIIDFLKIMVVRIVT
jgi:hypothetical protein